MEVITPKSYPNVTIPMSIYTYVKKLDDTTCHTYVTVVYTFFVRASYGPNCCPTACSGTSCEGKGLLDGRASGRLRRPVISGGEDSTPKERLEFQIC